MVLIVPEQFSFESEREMLSLLEAKDMQRLEILSFSRLAETVLEAYGKNNKRFIDDGARAVLMSIAVESVSQNLNIYKSAIHRENVINEFLQTSTELKQSGVKPKTLSLISDQLKESALKKKTHELSLILSAYDTFVDEKYFDDRNALMELCELLKDKPVFKDRMVFIDAFRGFTVQEKLVIEEILKQAKAVYITMCTDTIKDETDGFHVFSHTIRTVNELWEIAKRNNIPVIKPAYLSGPAKYNNFPPKIKRYNAPALEALEKSIYTNNPRNYVMQANEIMVCAADNYIQECDFVALTAKKLIREKGYRCRDIAVIERSPGNFRSSIVAAFKKYELPVFEDNKAKVDLEPLMQLVLCALDIIANGFSTELVIHYLKTGLAGLSIEETAFVENYVLMWQINGNGWKKEWNSHPEGYGQEFFEKDYKILERLNKLRDKIVSPLIELKGNISDKKGEQAARAVYEFLLKLNANEQLKNLAIELEQKGYLELSLTCERIWDLLMESLDVLAETIGEQTISLSRFFELFKLLIMNRELGNIPQGLDVITIGSADRIRITAPKVVFIVGANEGIFPANFSSGIIFTDDERRLLNKLGLELTSVSDYKAAEERFIAYNALSLATDKLFVSYSLADFTGNALVPSEIVTMIMKGFPNCGFVDYSEVSSIELIESKESAFEQTALKWKENSSYAASLRSFFEKAEKYKGRLETLKRVAENSKIKFQNPEISKSFFGNKISLSASRIETYYRCPFQYFCKYGLYAKPRKTAEFDYAQSGLAVHYVLEVLLTKYTNNDLVAFSIEQRKKEVKELLNKYANEFLGGFENMPKRLLYMLKKQEEIINFLLERLINEFSLSEFITKDVELSIGIDGDIAPYVIKLPDNSKLMISGKVDRVDVMEADDRVFVRVVDYKTGSKQFKLSHVFEGLNMQMLVYLICIWNNAKERYGEVTPAGVLYFPARTGSANLPRNATEQEIEKAKIKNGKMSGIVLNLPNVICGMEKDGKGLFLPASIAKDGTLKGSLISLEQLSVLRKKIDELLLDMANSLRQGKIPALPVSGSDYKDICEYCDYSAVCGHESAGEYRYIKNYKQEEALSFLEAVKENG